MDIYRHDETFRSRGVRRLAGIDEAGRGPLAGPVVAAAVVLPVGTTIAGLRDSKKVPPRELRSLFWEVFCSCLDVGIGIVGPEDIDRMNIYRATQYAMAIAAGQLAPTPDLLLTDAMPLPSLSIRQAPIVKGDAKSAAIAAASIIAKVVRDDIMERYDALYPLYGFGRHKGYGTRDHMDRIGRYGPCPIHRRSFEPVVALTLPFGAGG